MGVIFYLSHQEGASLPLPDIPFIDKFAHFIAYSVLAITALFAVPVSVRRKYRKEIATAVIMFGLFYGITDELHQSFIPGRFTSIADLCADLAGTSVVSLSWYLKKKREAFCLATAETFIAKLSGNSSGV